MPFLSSSELADWIASVDLADPLLRQFTSDLRTLEATGADPRWAMIVLLRHAADLETQDRTADATLELAAA